MPACWAKNHRMQWSRKYETIIFFFINKLHFYSRGKVKGGLVISCMLKQGKYSLWKWKIILYLSFWCGHFIDCILNFLNKRNAIGWLFRSQIKLNLAKWMFYWVEKQLLRGEKLNFGRFWVFKWASDFIKPLTLMDSFIIHYDGLGVVGVEELLRDEGFLWHLPYPFHLLGLSFTSQDSWFLWEEAGKIKK